MSLTHLGINGRKATLTARKAQIEANLQRESQSALPDSLKIATLKKEKLLLKDRLVGLTERAEG